jgi:murein DD-endopeptidase MepM/ murein hydrolase activator NlpD
MAKQKYYYNISSLRYEKVKVSWTRRLMTVFTIICTSLVFAVAIVYLIQKFIPSANEKRLQNELAKMEEQYDYSLKDLNRMHLVLESLRKRDINIYRVLYESEPLPDEVWQAGYGGSERYKELEGFSNSDLMKDLNAKIDKLKNQLVLQSKSYDAIAKLARNKEDMLASIPAIQPVSNADLTRIASGFGMRIDPIYRTPRMHTGLDFTAPIGTDIHVTGKGIIVEVEYNSGGYGNHVIVDHGFGYQSHYAHMSRFNCKVGEKVNRGDLIGYVGSTGKSTGPHLHYEIIYNGEKIDPVHFFFNDLTNDQYLKILDVAENAAKTLD